MLRVKLPKLEGTHPTGVTGQDGCISAQLGSSHARDSLTFLSVSGGVGGATSSLVSSGSSSWDVQLLS